MRIILRPGGQWVTYDGEGGDGTILEQKRVGPDVLLTGWELPVQVEALTVGHLLGMFAEMTPAARGVLSELLDVDLDAIVANGQRPSSRRPDARQIAAIKVVKEVNLLKTDDEFGFDFTVELGCFGIERSPQGREQNVALPTTSLADLREVEIVLREHAVFGGPIRDDGHHYRIQIAPKYMVRELLLGLFSEIGAFGSPDGRGVVAEALRRRSA